MSDHDHEALALAIADRDPQSAGALMADHLLALREAHMVTPVVAPFPLTQEY